MCIVRTVLIEHYIRERIRVKSLSNMYDLFQFASFRKTSVHP